MITHWRLSHFKSVCEPTELALAPLTVFAGANSSGKSTVIQSMLLTAQTLQSPVLSRPVILNGHMARLGAFTDLVSNADQGGTISIGFSLLLGTEPDGMANISLGLRSSRYLSRRMLSAGPLGVTCNYSFSMRAPDRDVEIRRLQPILEESEISVRHGSGNAVNTEEAALRRAKETLAERIRKFNLPPETKDTIEASSLEHELLRIVGAQSSRAREALVNPRNAGASLRHFLPLRYSVVYDAVETEVRQTVEALTSMGTSGWRELELDDDRNVLNDAVREIYLDSLETLRTSAVQTAPQIERTITRELDSLQQNFTAAAVRRLFRSLPPSLLGLVTQSLNERRKELEEAVRAGRSSQMELRYLPLPELLSAGIEATHQFFASSVRYLGPLRDEPKPVYPLAGATDPGDVGFRGEHTAAVLDVHRNTFVRYVPPSAFADDAITPQATHARLSSAVLDWLRYMGVGSDLHTHDRGKLGHELTVATTDSAPMHDLTQVGVGVSQLLPILVLSLLSDTGTTLIFEQPELHLHPKVQSRLADFFVAMTWLGKQCVIETHSEYLINRLRYRAATSAGRQISDSVILYFVEKQGGQSTYRDIRINEYGVIEDWPRGFFDENEETTAAVLRAGMAKRKRGRGMSDG